MSALLSVYVDDVTHARLEALAREMNRSVTDLAECAVAEAALDAYRGRHLPDAAA